MAAIPFGPPELNVPPPLEETGPLSEEALVRELQRYVEADERFKPLLAFASVSNDPDQSERDIIQQATDQIEQDTASVPVPDGAEWVPEVLFSNEVREADGSPAKYYEDIYFNNWGQTYNYTPSTTWVIRTKVGLQNLIKWAGKASPPKRVRAAGFRHTWSNLWGSNGDVLVMFLPMNTLVDLPYKPPSHFDSDFRGISEVTSVAGREPGPGHAFVKVGAETINEDFRAWCFQKKTWCLPFNVIMVEVTFGGTNAPICHGAGLSSTTLSDLVVEVTYVDANGVEQTVNDPDELHVASGAFGLLGIVTSLTLQVDTMELAVMMPAKLPMYLAIPPPPGFPLPQEVQTMMQNAGVTMDSAVMKKAKEDFVRRCEEDYYLEWFWFPYNNDCWVNTWKKRPLASGEQAKIETYPSDNPFNINGAAAQAQQARAAQALVSSWLWKKLSPWMQATSLGKASMWPLPNVGKPSDAIQAFVSDALHFRRGIQNFRVLDAEWEIPIPALRDGTRNYEAIQTAWWDGIKAMYNDNENCSVRVALEMRLTGGSEVVLAPQRGNSLGTISIEVLTTLVVDSDGPIWDNFRQKMTDIWTKYTDLDGNPLNIRPHWAKQWERTKVRNQPIEEYFKESAYKGAFEEFRQGFASIVTKRGSSVEATRQMFGTVVLDSLLYAQGAG